MRQQPSKALGLVLVFILGDSFGTVWSCGDLSGDILCLSVCHSFGRLYPRWRAKHAAPRGFTKLPPKRQGPALTTVRKIADQPSNPNRPGVRGECGTDQPTLGRRVLANQKKERRGPFFPNLREASNQSRGQEQKTLPTSPCKKNAFPHSSAACVHLRVSELSHAGESSAFPHSMPE